MFVAERPAQRVGDLTAPMDFGPHFPQLLHPEPEFLRLAASGEVETVDDAPGERAARPFGDQTYLPINSIPGW